MKLYFAYGANLNKEGMHYRCPQAQMVRSHRLKDWRLSFSGVATIQPSPGDTVNGAIWAITDECEKSLDTFEGYPTLYRKEYIRIRGHEVMFYVMNNDAPAEPGIGYLMTIAEGYQDWDLKLGDLWEAVRTTQHESYYDRYWNAQTWYGDEYDRRLSDNTSGTRKFRLRSGNKQILGQD